MPNPSTVYSSVAKQFGVSRMLLLALLWLVFTAFPVSPVTYGDSNTGFTAEAQSWAVVLQSHSTRSSSLESSDDDSVTGAAEPGQELALLAGLLLLWLVAQRSCLPLPVSHQRVITRNDYLPPLRAPPQP